MDSNVNISSFIAMSHQIGARSDYVQGAGGNTSMKLSNARMVVKASGFLLKEVSATTGYAVVDHTRMMTELQRDTLTEKAVIRIMKSACLAVDGISCSAPSIETGFHALLLNPFIIHSHSVYANLLTCSSEGKALSQLLFPQSIWIDYATPGQALMSKFAETLAEQEEAPIIFLANHGIFTGGKNAHEALHHHEMVTKIVCEHFHLKPVYSLKKLPDDMDFVKKHVLFPDQAVYALDGIFLESMAAQETLAAYDYIHRTLLNLGLTPRFIPEEKVAIIMQMESEKYRQSLVK